MRLLRHRGALPAPARCGDRGWLPASGGSSGFGSWASRFAAAGCGLLGALGAPHGRSAAPSSSSTLRAPAGRARAPGCGPRVAPLADGGAARSEIPSERASGAARAPAAVRRPCRPAPGGVTLLLGFALFTCPPCSSWASCCSSWPALAGRACGPFPPPCGVGAPRARAVGARAGSRAPTRGAEPGAGGAGRGARRGRGSGPRKERGGGAGGPSARAAAARRTLLLFVVAFLAATQPERTHRP